MVELDMDQKFLQNIYGNEKVIQCAKRTLYAVDGNVKQSFKMFKIKSF